MDFISWDLGLHLDACFSWFASCFLVADCLTFRCGTNSQWCIQNSLQKQSTEWSNVKMMGWLPNEIWFICNHCFFINMHKLCMKLLDKANMNWSLKIREQRNPSSSREGLIYSTRATPKWCMMLIVWVLAAFNKRIENQIGNLQNMSISIRIVCCFLRFPFIYFPYSWAIPELISSNSVLTLFLLVLNNTFYWK